MPIGAGEPAAAATVAPAKDPQLAGQDAVASLDTDAGAPVGAAFIVFIALLGTAGGLVLVGRRRGERTAEPVVAPTGVTPVADALPVSDPLLAALQGSARFAPADGTATGSQPATLGDGAPLWVRRLEPRIPVMHGPLPAETLRAETPHPEREIQLEDALGA